MRKKVLSGTEKTEIKPLKTKEFSIIFLVLLYPQKFEIFSLIFSSSKLLDNKISDI